MTAVRPLLLASLLIAAAPAGAGTLYKCTGADGIPNYTGKKVPGASCKVVSTYSAADALLAELRQLGRNLSAERFAGLRGRGWTARLKEKIESGLTRSPEGRLQLTFEIIYGHAFKPQPRKSAARQQNVSLDEMRSMLRGPRR